jgi:hypothetical protein
MELVLYFSDNIYILHSKMILRLNNENWNNKILLMNT